MHHSTIIKVYRISELDSHPFHQILIEIKLCKKSGWCLNNVRSIILNNKIIT